MKKYILMASIGIALGCAPSFAQEQHQENRGSREQSGGDHRDNTRHDNGGDHGDRRDNGRNVHHRQVRHHTSSRYRHSGDNQRGDNRQMSGDHRDEGRK